MTNLMTASKLREIYGHTITGTTLDGNEYSITILPPEPGWPRAGSEAFGLKTNLVIRERGSQQERESLFAFMKVFRYDVPARAERIRWLISRKLDKKNERFRGIPFGLVGRRQVNGNDITAHFTRMIPGPYNGGPEDFSRLRSSGAWSSFSRDERIRFAGELAAAVAGLEQTGIIHGDISSGNILIGASDANQRSICILCDYDGYANAQVARMPRKIGRTPCRAMGTPGYQYPDLIDDLASDRASDRDIWVQTDRFALGAAICEMMVWNQDVDDYVAREGRDKLLSDEIIRKRDLSSLPEPVRRAFPVGFDLLSQALTAKTAGEMPSPDDWLCALGVETPVDRFTGQPYVTVFRRRGSDKTRMQGANLTQTAGTFGPLSPALAGLNYTLIDSKLTFIETASNPIQRRRSGRLITVDTSRPISVSPGDSFYIQDLALEVEDRPSRA